MMLRVALILAVIRAQTPPPVSGPAEPSPPPAEPTPPSACADDATWHKKDDEAKNCQWVSQLLPTRCDVHGDSQTAQEACKKSCDSCEEGLEPPRRSTFAPTNLPSEEEECRTDICALPETTSTLSMRYVLFTQALTGTTTAARRSAAKARAQIPSPAAARYQDSS